MTAKANQLSAELEAYFAARELNSSPAWRPEPNETIIGEVIGFRTGADNGYGTYPIVVFRTETGTVSVHAFHTLLRDGYKRIGIRKGMRVATTYGGTCITNDTADKPEKDQTMYHDYFCADLDNLAAATEEAGNLFD